MNDLLEENGVIKAVFSDYIDIICQSKLDCQRCATGKGCGGGILARWLGDRQHQISVKYDHRRHAPKVGQLALVAFPAKQLVKLALSLYLLPLLVVALVLLLAAGQEYSEIVLLFIGFFALLVGVFLHESTLTNK